MMVNQCWCTVRHGELIRLVLMMLDGGEPRFRDDSYDINDDNDDNDDNDHDHDDASFADVLCS